MARSPAVLALGRALAQARTAAGLSQQQAARQLGVSQSLISRSERGSRTPDASAVALMIELYDPPGALRAELGELVDTVTVQQWSPVGSDEIAESLTDLERYERDASSITEVHPVLVPGPLQTREYAAALLAHGETPAIDMDQALAMRERRRAHVLGGDVRYLAIIDELALRRTTPPGGVDVRRGQLAALREWSRLPAVSVRVIPAERGFYRGLVAGFEIIEFDDAPAVVHLEHYRSSTWLYSERDVAPVVATRDHLLGVALSEEESRTRLRALEGEL
ncbi:helix-turn-helix domain-containing protein [Actinoalloteichus caeruleus]|uniref:helix-turn-helix domain-containing protein n=1 Tax=Actinoalloteichus cyanogriseus TaxID=2893586 RepID=UPI003AAB7E0B